MIVYGQSHITTFKIELIWILILKSNNYNLYSKSNQKHTHMLKINLSTL